MKVPNHLENLETELKLRGFSKQTIKSYILQNNYFLEYINKSPDKVTKEDIKKYIGYLTIDKQLKPSSINLILSCLRFFYKKLLDKDILEKIELQKTEKKIPIVLSKSEVRRLIGAISNTKHRILVKIMYSSGLRVSEAVSIKLIDLNLEEKVGTIRSGKGNKDRHIILSTEVIEDIKNYMAKRKDNNPYLFPIKDRHISIRMAQKIIKKAAERADIHKRVFCHCLRSSFATHLLEEGVDIRKIQVLLGHSNLATTERYTKVSTEQLKKIKSPLDSI